MGNEMRREEKLTDLSFVCRKSDRSFQVIDAHQVIFSTISEDLKMLINVAKHKQPYEKVVIIIDSVNSADMEKLVQYIYTGEVNANATEKQNLVQLCALLKLNVSLKLDTAPTLEYETPLQEIFNRDLYWHWTQTSQELITLVNGELSTPNHAYSSKEKEITNTGEVWSCVTMDETEISKDKPKAASAIEIQTKEGDMIHQSGVANKRIRKPVKKFQVHRLKKSVFPRKISSCKFCTKVSNIIGDLNMHILHVHDKITRFNCGKCSYSAKTKQSLIIHHHAVHDGIRKFNCDECSYCCHQKGNLKTHIYAKHRNKKT